MAPSDSLPAPGALKKVASGATFELWQCRASSMRLEPIHMFFRSPLVRMGVAVADLALGGFIKTCALRASYDLAVKHLGIAPNVGRHR